MSCRHRTEHKDRMFNVSDCDPAVHKRCSFLQLTTTYCGMWAGLRKDVRFAVHYSAGRGDTGGCEKAPDLPASVVSGRAICAELRCLLAAKRFLTKP